MGNFLNQMFFAFLALFPILNPPAMAPIFVRLTGHVTERERNRLAWRIGFYTFVMLTSLLMVGGWALKLLGISIPVISIAGGLLLFHSAWTMLNKTPKMSVSETEELEGSMADRAFFPLTLPVTAGPGSIAVTLSLVPSGRIWAWATLLEFIAVAAGIALAAVSVFIFYRFSTAFLRRLGAAGSATISQISAFVLLAIGVQIVWSGIQALLHSL